MTLRERLVCHLPTVCGALWRERGKLLPHVQRLATSDKIPRRDPQMRSLWLLFTGPPTFPCVLYQPVLDPIDPGRIREAGLLIGP